MANQAHYGKGYPPQYNLQNDKNPMALGLDQSHLSRPLAQQQEEAQQQAHFTPPNHPYQAPQPGPALLNHARYMLHQPYQHLPPPGMLPPHQHYGNMPPPPPPPPLPPPQFMGQRPMYSEMMTNNFPSQQPKPHFPWSRSAPVPVAAAAPLPQNKTTSTLGQAKKDKMNKESSINYSSPPVFYGQPSNVYKNGTTLGKSEREFVIELEKAKEAMAVMFPRLSERIQSTVLCLLVNDFLSPRGKMKYFLYFSLELKMNPLPLPFLFLLCRD